MNAKNAQRPNLPISLTYDNSTGAHGVGCVYFPDGFALDTAGGPGADPRAMPAYREAMMREVVRRWNAHRALLAALEDALVDLRHLAGPVATIDKINAALRLARGE